MLDRRDVQWTFRIILGLFVVSFVLDSALPDYRVPSVIYALVPMAVGYAFGQKILDGRQPSKDPKGELSA